MLLPLAITAGNNSVEKTWKSVGLESGKTGSTILDVGTDPSNITQTEKDNVTSGDVVELVCNVDTPATNTAVEALADIAISEWQADMGRILRYFGHTIT